MERHKSPQLSNVTKKIRPVENGADTRGGTDRWTNGLTDTQTGRKSRSQWALFTNITTRLKMAQTIKPKHVAEILFFGPCIFNNDKK